KLIRKVLLEEVEKRNSINQEIYKRLPEVISAKDLENIIPKRNDRYNKSEILDIISKAVKSIDSSATVVWDDHDDIMVSSQDLFRVRIIPRWENNFNIEAFIRNEDRIYISNQNLDQVVEFLKTNFKNIETSTRLAYNKSIDNATMEYKLPAPDKGLPQKDKPKILPFTNEKLSEKKNKERNYTEKQVKEESDLPEKPMREVKDFKRQIEYKSRSPISIRTEKTKYPSKKPNTRLTVPFK
ncbi:MAG TPA: hypothetical protein PL028_09990, partial [Bacteroidales bacterium]|nr:hypothetical protein [Bacteroidales bacterium]